MKTIVLSSCFNLIFNLIWMFNLYPHDKQSMHEMTVRPEYELYILVQSFAALTLERYRQRLKQMPYPRAGL